MEISDPRHAFVRCALLDYLVTMRDTCKTEIFDFHQVDGIELAKNDNTMQFLKKYMKKLGGKYLLLLPLL